MIYPVGPMGADHHCACTNVGTEVNLLILCGALLDDGTCATVCIEPFIGSRYVLNFGSQDQDTTPCTLSGAGCCGQSGVCSCDPLFLVIDASNFPITTCPFGACIVITE